MLITSFGCLGGLGGRDSEFGDFDLERYPQNMSLTQVKTTLMSFVLLLGLLVFPSPASAEVFDTITTPGDGWDVTFHPTNQNYAFFAHHRNRVFGCFYRVDPDGAGPIEQGDGCFNGGYTLDIGGRVGQRSSVWVTSDGNTAYIPRNYGLGETDLGADYGDSLIAKVDISDADPNNWSVTGTANFAQTCSTTRTQSWWTTCCGQLHPQGS